MHIQSDSSQSVLVSTMDNENPTTVSQSNNDTTITVGGDSADSSMNKNGNGEVGLVQTAAAINDNSHSVPTAAAVSSKVSAIEKPSNNLIDLAEESSSELADLAAADSKALSSASGTAANNPAVTVSSSSAGNDVSHGEEQMSTASEASSSVLREDVTKRPVTVAVSVSESVMAMTPTSPRSITTASMSASGKTEINIQLFSMKMNKRLFRNVFTNQPEITDWTHCHFLHIICSKIALNMNACMHARGEVSRPGQASQSCK